MSESQVTLEQLTREELASFLPPEVLKNTLASLKLIYEVMWEIKVWRGLFVQFEPRNASQRWIMENENVVNTFTVNLMESWKKCQQLCQPLNTGFTDSYERKNNVDEYISRPRCTPVADVTEEAVLTVRKCIVRR